MPTAELTARPAAAPASPSVPEGISWGTVTGLGVIHAGGLAGLVYLILRPSLATAILAGVMYLLGGLSITAGYHRLFAHRTYRASAPVRWFFLAFGASTFQNSALSWSADHRAHHADTDGPGDPHAIKKGAWWAHMGWLFYRRECSADVSRLTDLSACAASGCSTVLRGPGHRPRPRRTRWPSRRCGATPGAGCWSPGSSGAPSCSRPRSASTRSPTCSAAVATTGRSRRATAW